MTVKEDFNVLSAGVFFTSECFNFDTIDIIHFIYNTLKGRSTFAIAINCYIGDDYKSVLLSFMA